jgi:hypothetical protein
LSPGYWLRAQAAHDTGVASAELAEEIERIEPLVGNPSESIGAANHPTSDPFVPHQG